MIENANDFRHIIRMQNTNVQGKQKVAYGLRIIKGMGRRFTLLALKIAQIDSNIRAGELTDAQIDKISDIISKPVGKCFAS